MLILYKMTHERDPKNLLYKAIKEDNLDDVKNLMPQIDKYIIRGSLRGMGENLLCYALSMGSTNVFYYLATQIDVDHKYENGSTILNHVANHQFTSIDELSHVLNQSKDIDKKFIGGRTILHVIVYNMYQQHKENIEDYKKRLEKIIEHGADPFIKNDMGSSAIDLSANHFYAMESLPILLKTKINKCVEISTLNKIIKINGIDNVYDVIELLLPFIKNINELDSEGRSALWYAKKYMSEEIDIIELLEENGARVLDKIEN